MQRHGRFSAEPPRAIVEKRGLDASEFQEAPQEPKRQKVPALASVVIEALKVDSLQKIFSSIEPILRRVVSEEVERALAKMVPSKIIGRSSPPRIGGPDGRTLQLQFRTKLPMSLFTGAKVEGEQGAAIHVVLLDANTNHVVISGPESSAKLDVVVLEGDFNKEDDENWTEEEFECAVVKEREGKRPLLTGDMQVTLKGGIGTVGDLMFTDNSSWIRSRKFRLGLKIASGFCEGIRIREAKTESFTVKDHRGELYKKHFPPSLSDEVWRLKKIGKDGSFHKKLSDVGITTVEDFLRMLVRDPQKLRRILGSTMSNKMWEELVEHAKTCVLGGKFYVYYSDETRNVGAIFNHIYELCGLTAYEQYYPAETLPDDQKEFLDSLVKKAYDNWMHVIEYDGKTLINCRGNSVASSSNEITSVSTNNPSKSQQLSALPSTQDGSMSSNLSSGDNVGYEDQVARYSDVQHSHISFNSTCDSQNHFLGPHQSELARNNSVGLALSVPQATNLDQPLVPSITPSQFHYDDFFTEDEIRMRSNELLENEDMQQLLRGFTMGGYSNVGNDGFSFLSYNPTPVFNEDRRSGKAVVGWLKIKAAMRWGIFVRKKAAERRRANLIELDDDEEILFN